MSTEPASMSAGQGPGTTKQPAVAGLFYPDDASELRGLVARYLDSAATTPELAPKAIIAPHAGYPFSGPVAGHAYHTLGARRTRIARAVIASPPHTAPVPGMAVPSFTAMATPLGDVAVDRDGVAALAAMPGVATDDGPFAREHGIEVHLPFLQHAIGEHVQVVPLLVGTAPPDRVAAALRTVWGGDDTLIVISSDLSHFLDRARAESLDAATSTAIELLDTDALGDNSACGRHAIAGLLTLGRESFARTTTLARASSADAGAPPDKVVGYGAYSFEPGPEAALDGASRAALLHAARAAVEAQARTGAAPAAPDPAMYPAPLRAQRASFVTLYLDGQLRACLGSRSASAPLVADAVANAAAAATRDPRVPPVSVEELPRLSLSVAVLSPAVPARARTAGDLADEITPGADGVVLEAGSKAGLFLPQVWDQAESAGGFVAALLAKAGLNPAEPPGELRAWRFRAETIAEAGAAS